MSTPIKPYPAVDANFKMRYTINCLSGFFYSADVAQLAEQLICNQQVTSSSLVVGSSNLRVFGQGDDITVR